MSAIRRAFGAGQTAESGAVRRGPEDPSHDKELKIRRGPARSARSSGATPPLGGGATSGPQQEQNMNPDEPLGDRLRRLAMWADQTPRVHRPIIVAAIDRLAILLACVLDGDDGEAFK